jgi:hypothetical protein
VSDRERDTHARENRVLMNLAREPRTTRQLWQVGGRNPILDALNDARLIFALKWRAGVANSALWSLTPAGERELASRIANGMGWTVCA